MHKTQRGVGDVDRAWRRLVLRRLSSKRSDGAIADDGGGHEIDVPGKTKIRNRNKAMRR